MKKLTAQRTKSNTSDTPSEQQKALAGMQEVNIERTYMITKKLGTGRWGNIHFATHRQSGSQIALKIFPRETIKQADFIREYNNSRFLTAHQNIINTFEGACCTPTLYFFVQELSPC